MEKKLSIDGMSCGHCSGRVKKYLEETDGITNVDVSLDNKEATFSCTENTNFDKMVKDINGFGFKAAVK